MKIKNSIKEMHMLTQQKFQIGDRVLVWYSGLAIPVGFCGTITDIEVDHLYLTVDFDHAWKVRLPLFSVCQERSYRFYPTGSVRDAWKKYRKLRKKKFPIPKDYQRLKSFLEAHNEHIETVIRAFDQNEFESGRRSLIAAGNTEDHTFIVAETANDEWTIEKYTY